MKLKKTILLLVLIISYSYICAENWVGQAATYQLVEGTLTAGKEPFSGSSLTAAYFIISGSSERNQFRMGNWPCCCIGRF